MNNMILLVLPIPAGSIVQYQESTAQPVIPPTGENEKMYISTQFPQLCRTYQQGPFLFWPTQSTEV